MPRDRIDGVFETDLYLKEGDSLRRHGFSAEPEVELPEDFIDTTNSIDMKGEL